MRSNPQAMAANIAATFQTVNPFRGLALASIILLGWILNLALMIGIWNHGSQVAEFSTTIWLGFGFCVLIQCFLCTGLFITAHDAMHRSIHPNPKINHAVGALCAFLYAGFWYPKLLKNHHKHHAKPATADDPDYTRFRSENFFLWLGSFIFRYYGLLEFVLVHLHVHLIRYWTGSYTAMFLIFALPAGVGALQLFYFGTYLPHQLPEGGHKDSDRATTNDYPEWLSLITCYHFGYHNEHHKFPWVPWWGLPKVRRVMSPKKSDRSQ
jgi:beta-carotene ketolase (CrtW type)